MVVLHDDECEGGYTVERVLAHDRVLRYALGSDGRSDGKAIIVSFLPREIETRYLRAGVGVSELPPHVGSYYERGRDEFRERAHELAAFRRLSSLSLPLAVIEADGVVSAVMPSASGPSLEEYCTSQGGQIEAGMLWDLVSECLDELAVLHEAGLVHGGISPNTMHLGASGLCLGVPDLVGPTYRAIEPWRFSPDGAYRPLEQRSQARWDPRVDVYALSAVLYRCLTGLVPPAAHERKLGKRLVEPHAVGVRLPREEERTLIAGLNVLSSRRPRSALELSRLWR